MMATKRNSDRGHGPEIAVATIGLIGIVAAALIAKLPDQSVTPSLPSSNAAKPQGSQLTPVAPELISILNLRAEIILNRMKSREREILLNHEDTTLPNADLLKAHSSIRSRFLELHAKNVTAIQRGQLLLSHELTREIQILLLEYEKAHPAKAAPAGPELTTDESIIYAIYYENLRGVFDEQLFLHIALQDYPGPIPTNLSPWRSKEASVLWENMLPNESRVELNDLSLPDSFALELLDGFGPASNQVPAPDGGR